MLLWCTNQCHSIDGKFFACVIIITTRSLLFSFISDLSFSIQISIECNKKRRIYLLFRTTTYDSFIHNVVDV